MNDKPRILVTGATDRVGKLVIPRLVANKNVGTVAAVRSQDRHGDQTHRLGYEAITLDDIGAILTRVIGQPFFYESRPSEEFYENVVTAGAETSYMKCDYDSYTGYTAGRVPNSDELFEHFQAITGGKQTAVADSAKKNEHKFRH
jgi:uncharacterized protein YbjT (DUF2867 family)